MVRYHMIVYGKVQGVGFRFYTLQQASLFQINGWVRNREDGTVEIDAEGEAEQMKRFIDAVKKGPPFSRVEQVEQTQVPEKKNYRSFTIEY